MWPLHDNGNTCEKPFNSEKKHLQFKFNKNRFRMKNNETSQHKWRGFKFKYMGKKEMFENYGIHYHHKGRVWKLKSVKDNYYRKCCKRFQLK